ncbi:hypothetical protein Gpo141_00003870 [Globisporangium polare]
MSPTFTSPFAPLELSTADIETLEKLSRMILLNYMTQYEEYARARANGEGDDGVDARVWKLVKQRKSFRIFKQRKRHSDSNSGDHSGDDSAVRRALEGYTNSEAVVTPNLPVVLAMGTTPGALDDVMYGVVNPTIEVLRVKSSYIDDHFADVAVLATLATPTQEDPYQSLLIKWGHLGPPIMLRPAVNNRDFVYMERIGLAYTSTGERVGYHLIHSVHFPQTHELPGTLRGNMTIGGIFRDNKELKQVEMHTRSTIDPRGSALHAIVVLAAADMLTVAEKYVECCQRKKLMWRLRRAQRSRSVGGDSSEHQSSVSSASGSSSASTDKLGPCTICLKVPLKIGSMLRDQRKRTCALCFRYVCSSCKVKKTLSQVASPTAKLRQRSYSFCGVCYTDVCQSDTLALARQELAAGEEGELAIESSSVESDLVSLTNSQ